LIIVYVAQICYLVNFTVGDFEPNLYDHRPISINLLSHY
jgi:hypothetical protein